ncbi:MAG: hypothetical protein ACRC8S_07880 [Fimbriiglobus sp.]
MVKVVLALVYLLMVAVAPKLCICCFAVPPQPLVQSEKPAAPKCPACAKCCETEPEPTEQIGTVPMSSCCCDISQPLDTVTAELVTVPAEVTTSFSNPLATLEFTKLSVVFVAPVPPPNLSERLALLSVYRC